MIYNCFACHSRAEKSENTLRKHNRNMWKMHKDLIKKKKKFLSKHRCKAETMLQQINRSVITVTLGILLHYESCMTNLFFIQSCCTVCSEWNYSALIPEQ